MLLLLFPILVICFTGQCDSSCDLSSKWMRESILAENGKMVIKWNFTDKDLTMMMIAQTKGWIAVGFGPRRDNFVDLALGWVSNKMIYLEDEYIQGKATEPTLDKTKSLWSLGGGETENSTYICFRRQLVACDDQDYTITEGTIKLTWAFSNKEPVNGKLGFQSAMKGEKLIHLLSVVYPKPSSGTYSIRARNATITAKQGTTVYWCTYYQLSPTTDQNYMLGFDSEVAMQNMEVVHHISIYECNQEIGKVYKTIAAEGYNCNNENKTQLVALCRNVIAVWAMGGENQYFPPSTGTPFGSPTENTFYRLEIHYNLQPQTSDFKDDSGIRLYISKEKPKNIAAILFTGAPASPFMIIPPGQKDFSVVAVCREKCLQQNIPKEGLTLIGIRFHAHKTGRKFKLHIFRNNKELKPLVEENFDFVYQGFRFFKDKQKLYPNDTLAMECSYDTSTINQTIVGNEATDEEMCLIYILYYPLMENFEMCGSFIIPKNILNLTGLQEIGPPEGIPKCEGPECPSPYAVALTNVRIPIIKPVQYANETLDVFLKNFTNWTQANVQKLKQFYFGEQNSVCIGNSNIYDSKATDIVRYPMDASPYLNPNICRKN